MFANLKKWYLTLLLKSRRDKSVDQRLSCLHFKKDPYLEADKLGYVLE